MATRNNKTPEPGDVIPITDFTTPSDDLTVEEQIVQKYGTEYQRDITNIYLYRFPVPNNRITKILITSYEELPDWSEIQKQYGGGEYMLWINFRRDDGKKSIEKIYQSIAGKPLDPVYANETAKPEDKPDTLKQFLEFKKTDRELSPAVSPGTGSDPYILKMLEQQAQILMKLIEGGNKQAPDDKFKETLLQTLLTTALQKSSGEFDKLKDMLEIMDILKDGGSEKSEMWGIVKDLLKEGKELLPAILAAKSMAGAKQPGGPVYIAPVNGAPAQIGPAVPQGGMEIPSGGAEALPGANTDVLGRILQSVEATRLEMNELRAKVARLEDMEDDADLEDMSLTDALEESAEILKDAYPNKDIPVDEPEAIAFVNNKSKFFVFEKGEIKLFEKLKELVQAAPEPKRLEVLAYYLNLFPEPIVRNFCVKWVFNSIDEYNELKAKLEVKQPVNNMELHKQ